MSVDEGQQRQPVGKNVNYFSTQLHYPFWTKASTFLLTSVLQRNSISRVKRSVCKLVSLITLSHVHHKITNDCARTCKGCQHIEYTSNRQLYYIKNVFKMKDTVSFQSAHRVFDFRGNSSWLSTSMIRELDYDISIRNCVGHIDGNNINLTSGFSPNFSQVTSFRLPTKENGEENLRFVV